MYSVRLFGFSFEYLEPLDFKNWYLGGYRCGFMVRRKGCNSKGLRIDFQPAQWLLTSTNSGWNAQYFLAQQTPGTRNKYMSKKSTHAHKINFKKLIDACFSWKDIINRFWSRINYRVYNGSKYPILIDIYVECFY